MSAEEIAKVVADLKTGRFLVGDNSIALMQEWAQLFGSERRFAEAEDLPPRRRSAGAGNRDTYQGALVPLAERGPVGDHPDPHCPRPLRHLRGGRAREAVRQIRRPLLDPCSRPRQPSGGRIGTHLQDRTRRHVMAQTVEGLSTSNLVIRLQKMAKEIVYYKPGYRRALLEEAARRLTRYRQAEREETP